MHDMHDFAEQSGRYDQERNGSQAGVGGEREQSGSGAEMRGGEGGAN